MANSLNFAMGTMDTFLTLSTASTFSPEGGVVQIDSEQIQYTMSSDVQLIGLVRGINGTVAATHVKGATVTSLESNQTSPTSDPSFPLVPRLVGDTQLLADNAGRQTDPAAITQAMIDSSNVLWLFGHAGNISLSLPTPTVSMASRKLYVLFTTDAAKTCSINSVSIAAGFGQVFVYDAGAAAWFAC